MNNIQDYLKELKRSSKKDDIPGTVSEVTQEKCPACNKEFLKLYKPCCGSPKGSKGCRCGYKIILT
jgi:hypothetical protein